MSADTLNRFIFPVASVRGELVHLDESWRTVLERRAIGGQAWIGDWRLP